LWVCGCCLGHFVGKRTRIQALDKVFGFAQPRWRGGRCGFEKFEVENFLGLVMFGLRSVGLGVRGGGGLLRRSEEDLRLVCARCSSLFEDLSSDSRPRRSLNSSDLMTFTCWSISYRSLSSSFLTSFSSFSSFADFSRK
jgi:hypothetical protein